MASIIIGVVAAVFFSKAGAVVVDGLIGISRWSQIVAFLSIFLLVYLAIRLLEGLLQRVLEKIHLERLDRALGLVLGFAEGAIVVVLAIYLIRVQPLFDPGSILDDSVVAQFVLEIVPIFAPDGDGAGATGV